MSVDCLCVVAMACICCLFIDVIGLYCGRCSVIALVFLAFGVYLLFVVCCVAVCCFIGLSCVYTLLLSCFPVCMFCYGLNAFPVCDCMSYAPSLRCSFLFV